ncbi:unnamed protein product, partial [Phaeothamnion confervicola]
GYADTQFGYFQGRHSVRAPLPQPVQVSLILTSADRWCCVNVGVDTPDTAAKDLSLVWLVVDFFSLYHRSELFGCPAAPELPGFDAAAAPPEPPLPPRSVDVRVFVTRPHLAVLESPLSPGGAALVLECEQGLYFRYQWLSMAEVMHLEAAAQGLLAVVANAYWGPLLMRGVRGTAGSGRGVQTVLEHFSCGFEYNQWRRQNRLEVVARVPLRDDEDLHAGGEADAEQYGLDGPPPKPADFRLPLPVPKALHPPERLDADLGPRGGDVVTSYDDALFVAAALAVFVGPEPPLPARQPQQPSVLQPPLLPLPPPSPPHGKANGAGGGSGSAGASAGASLVAQLAGGFGTAGGAADPAGLPGGAPNGGSPNSRLPTRGGTGLPLSRPRPASRAISSAAAAAADGDILDTSGSAPGSPGWAPVLVKTVDAGSDADEAAASATGESGGDAGSGHGVQRTLSQRRRWKDEFRLAGLSMDAASSDEDGGGGRNGGGKGGRNGGLGATTATIATGTSSRSLRATGASLGDIEPATQMSVVSRMSRRITLRGRGKTEGSAAAALAAAAAPAATAADKSPAAADAATTSPRDLFGHHPSLWLTGNDRRADHAESYGRQADKVAVAPTQAHATPATAAADRNGGSGAIPAAAAEVSGKLAAPPPPPPPFTMTVLAFVSGVRIIIADHVLGLHLPVVKLCLGDVACVVEQRLEADDAPLEKRPAGRSRPEISAAGGGAGVGAGGAGGNVGNGGGGYHPAIPALKRWTLRRGSAAALSSSAVAAAAAAAAEEEAANENGEGSISRPARGATGALARHLRKDSDEESFFSIRSAPPGMAAAVGGGSRGGGSRRQSGSRNGRGRSDGLQPTEACRVLSAQLDRDPQWSSARAALESPASADGAGSSGVGGRTRAGGAAGGQSPLRSVKFCGPDDGVRPSGGVGGFPGGVPGGDCSHPRPVADGDGAAPLAVVFAVTAHARLWADYFNNRLRCWEPLAEPFQGWLFIEQGRHCGSGISVRALSPLHINVTGALLDTLSDVQERIGQTSGLISGEYFRQRVEKMRAETGRPRAERSKRRRRADTGAVTTTSGGGGGGAMAAADGSGAVAGLGSGNGGGSSGGGALPIGRRPVSLQRWRDGRDDRVGENDEQPADSSCDVPGGRHAASPYGSALPHLFNAERGGVTDGSAADTSTRGDGGGGEGPNLNILHRFEPSLPLDARKAFTILNLTGQRLRYYQPRVNAAARRVQYLRHGERGMLVFGAAMTVVRNGEVQ